MDESELDLGHLFAELLDSSDLAKLDEEQFQRVAGIFVAHEASKALATSESTAPEWVKVLFGEPLDADRIRREAENASEFGFTWGVDKRMSRSTGQQATMHLFWRRPLAAASQRESP